MTRAFLFPGQGSQIVGMGKELADAFAVARAVFEEVDEALGQKLSHLMWNGPEAELTLTENAQPALMATSLAVTRVIEAETGKCLADLGVAVAGHSLGEYSALAAVGALTVSDTARLLKRRGQAMQKAVPLGTGAMAALLGVEISVAQEIAEAAAQGEVCDIANDNGGGQVVLSGTAGAIARAVAFAPTKGVKRALPLPVSAPFHCRLMQPAADTMADALANVTMVRPSLPIVINVTARPEQDTDKLRRSLVEQVTGRVRWNESIAHMANVMGISQFVELGSGKVLTGLVKRIAKDATGLSISGPADIEAFLKTL
ncbi:ACP S-malonyltransferase [Elstera litoralis]|uniref:Malonyl CoA-acyl carrier protein transacylase n=1 Tax=Elstera litoralis TaxID=552518 RepID=A0A0F3ISE1_9PROT|nr:ACP S-malonyltransferase [Elstera litoralis]KJV09611.1 ACP S-malonyltransferase [Elstera litoralis]